MSAREEAIRRLRRIESEGAYAALVDVADDELDARDVRFATELVSGTTRWRRWLDFLIAQFYRGDINALDVDLRLVLRVALYELLILETPAHAAVNEAVQLARKLVRPGAGGLVNGILRNVDRRRGALPEPATGDAARDLSIRHSHPTWMVKRWVERFGHKGAASLLEWNNSRPTYGVRINSKRISRDDFLERLRGLEVEWQESPFLADFLRIRSLQPLVRGGLLRDGLCVVQDEGAGLIVHLLEGVDELVVDACAAPGGKALYAASRMNGRVVAVDVHQSRATLIGRAAERLGIGNVDIRVGDARDLRSIVGAESSPAVLLDAPCSGLGVLNKRADLRWRRTPEQLQDLVELQGELLDGCARAVRPGGILVYGTCSIEPDENEGQIEQFLMRHAEFELEQASPFVPAELVTEEGYYKALPHRNGIDGAFGARLRKRSH